MEYSPENWHELFVAAAGAAAALAGLIFVAVSINIDRILKLKGVPERALQAVVMLLGVLLVSFLGLAPQSREALGIEVLILGVALIGVFGRTIRATLQDLTGPRLSHLYRVVLPVVGSVPYVAAGVSLLVGAGGGLYWILAGFVAATAGAVANAWVLLVEILR